MKKLKIIGLSVRTENTNGKSVKDLTQLWHRFFEENVVEKVHNKVNGNIYCIYTDYESDYTAEYTALLGVQVSGLTEIPEGLTGREFESQKFKEFVAKGEMPAAVANTWRQIWEMDKSLNRSYTYDYELYSERSQKGNQSEVNIFIAVK